MFDISFSELLLVGAVALVVLGPERLPAAARTAGGLMRKARASWQSVRAEFEREVASSELRRSVSGIRDEVNGLAAGIDSPSSTSAPRDGRERRAPHD